MLAQLHYAQYQQKVASWTGFNIQVHDRECIVKINVGHLPTINAPATSMSTIKEDLDQSRMIIIAESRHLHMQEVLQHPLGPLPSSLATSNGLPRKTNKAQLGRELEKVIEPTTQITSPSVYLIDGMALVQKLKVSDHMTFGQIVDAALPRVLQEGGNSKRIDVVFDVYNEISIKPAEREQRGKGES